MDYLPPELISRIFSFLDPESIVICRQVCRKWWILSTKWTNPLYLPRILNVLILYLRFREGLKARLVCKLFKQTLDKQTLNEKVTLKGRTDLNSVNVNSLHYEWNPFPSRIVRMEMCRRHQSTDSYLLENDPSNLLMMRYGKQILYLQLLLHNTSREEIHFKTLIKSLENICGLVIAESPPVFGGSSCTTSDEEQQHENPQPEMPLLTTLRFLRLDDSESKLKYSELYHEILVNSPNLEHLDIHGHFHISMNIVKLIPTLSCLTILKMDIEDPYVQETLESLEKIESPLKHLAIKILAFGDAIFCHTCTSLLHNSLQKLSNTLEELELKLSWDYFGEGPPFQPEILQLFPSGKHLSKLCKLKLVGFRGNLDFLSDMISLKCLMVVDYNSETQRVFDSEKAFSDHLPKLSELYLPLQRTYSSESGPLKNKMRDFMVNSKYYKYDAKYCGLYQLEFP